MVKIVGVKRLAAKIEISSEPLQPLPSPIIDRRQQPNPSGNIFGIMSQRPPQSQQPVQPVPAMKKGGIVRGGRAETKGTRPAKLY